MSVTSVKSMNRKIKKLEYENDEYMRRNEAKRYSSETDLIKKKYSWLNYENRSDDDDENDTKNGIKTEDANKSSSSVGQYVSSFNK